MNKKIKIFIVWAFLFYVLLITPILIFGHLKPWYEYNFEKDNIYEEVGYEIVQNATDNLVGFFYYREELNNLWSQKEKAHFEDVREIFFKSFIILVAMLGFLYINKKIVSENKRGFVIINMITIVLLSSLVIVFFNFFWNNIFHKILFSNNLWIMDKGDLSYYLFKEGFFIKTSLWVFILFVIENIMLFGTIFLYNKKSLYKKEEKS